MSSDIRKDKACQRRVLTTGLTAGIQLCQEPDIIKEATTLPFNLIITWSCLHRKDTFLEMLQHLCCSYPAVAMVNTNILANRGISTTVDFTPFIETINPSSSSQYFQHLEPSRAHSSIFGPAATIRFNPSPDLCTFTNLMHAAFAPTGLIPNFNSTPCLTSNICTLRSSVAAPTRS